MTEKLKQVHEASNDAKNNYNDVPVSVQQNAAEGALTKNAARGA